MVLDRMIMEIKTQENRQRENRYLLGYHATIDLPSLSKIHIILINKYDMIKIYKL